mgnify:FL=1|tara:strand:+ start:6140 stop:6334 length:195 start_codon:yes stop_codon:yes gene_type:complete
MKSDIEEILERTVDECLEVIAERYNEERHYHTISGEKNFESLELINEFRNFVEKVGIELINKYS